MMDNLSIEKIEQLVKDRLIVKSGDKDYTAASLKPIIFDPRPNTLIVHSLRGFCGFINNDIDKLINGKPHLIVVNSPDSVDLISAVIGENMKRTILISANTSDTLKEFPFAKFLLQEDFAILFRSLFVKKDNDDYDYVLSYASKLIGGTQLENDDDGITQKATIKRGVSGVLKEKEALRPIVKLSPYRTFREVEQSQSEFLFRVKLDANDNPTVALFEADGGAWENDATHNIVEYIQSLIPNIPVIA